VSDASDRELVLAFKSGDEQAYDEIYRRHSPKVRAVCSRRLSQPFDADEAVQETFLRAYQALGRFNGQYKLGAWLNRIAVNVCIDELRTRARSDVVDDIGDRVDETERGPDEIISTRRPEVIDALNELKPLHANVLRLRALDELTHEELAARLHITPAQVKSLLHRARAAFKRVVREASGFVMIPLAALRRQKKHGHLVTAGAGGANVMGVLSSMHVSLPAAERLMTGIVVAAVALGTAAPTTPSSGETERTTRRGSATVRARDVRDLRDAKAQPLPPAPIVRRSAVTIEEEEILPQQLPVDLIEEVVEVPHEVRERVEQELEERSTNPDAGPHVGDGELEDVQHEIEEGAAGVKHEVSEVTTEVLQAP
jgi:RNA polymerase sigma-70 factor, ECF subfamily